MLRPCLVAIALCVVGAVQAAPELPEGWAVHGMAPDPQLSTLSAEALIDLLTSARPHANPPPRVNASAFWPLSGQVDLGRRSFRLVVDAPALLELVHRGPTVLPTLLEHVTDPRATELVYVVKRELNFADIYDARDRGEPVGGVNTGWTARAAEEDTYRFRVGDLCYAAVGQIVNRDLRPLRSNHENVSVFSGTPNPNPGHSFSHILSPVARAELAAAVRNDWAGCDEGALNDSLRTDTLTRREREPTDVEALLRLLYYFPSVGVIEAEALLRRTLIQPAPDELDQEGPSSIEFSRQAQFVEALAPFSSQRLDAAVLALLRDASAVASAEVKERGPRFWHPAIPALGSDLVLKCAQRLVHRGHDDELRRVVRERLTAIESAIAAPGMEARIRFVIQLQAHTCREVLTAIDAEAKTTSSLRPVARWGVTPQGADASPTPPARGLVRMGPLVVKRSGLQLAVTAEVLEPTADRVVSGKLILTDAIDSVGVRLLPALALPSAPVRMHTAGGTQSPSALTFNAALSAAAKRATHLPTMRGRLELLVPDADRDACVDVPDMAAVFGSPVVSPSLVDAGVSISVLDPSSIDQWQQPGVASPTPPEVAAAMRLRLEPGQIAVATANPKRRLQQVVFVDAAGRPLTTRAVSQLGGSDWEVTIYRIENPAAGRIGLRIHLKTEASTFVYPFHLTDVAILD